MRIYLQTPFTPERPPRYYHLFLQKDLLGGWSLVRQWGFQGASGTLRREHYSDRDAAIDALMRHRDAQIKKGYKVMFFQGDEAPKP